jgi:hypothetical protein
MYKLYKININTEDDGFYRFEPNIDCQRIGAKVFTIKGNDSMLMKFLRRCKVCDTTKQPRSLRALTYKEMLCLINQGSADVFIFAHMYPKTQVDFEGIMR